MIMVNATGGITFHLFPRFSRGIDSRDAKRRYWNMLWFGVQFTLYSRRAGLYIITILKQAAKDEAQLAHKELVKRFQSNIPESQK